MRLADIPIDIDIIIIIVYISDTIQGRMDEYIALVLFRGWDSGRGVEREQEASSARGFLYSSAWGWRSCSHRVMDL